MSAPVLTGNTTRFIVETMTHRCTIQRNVSVIGLDGTPAIATDADGSPLAPDWQELASDQACFLYTADSAASSGQETRQSTAAYVFDRLKLIVPKGIGLNALSDRILSLETRQGDTLAGGVFDVCDVRQHHTHDELVLERVSGTEGV